MPVVARYSVAEYSYATEYFIVRDWETETHSRIGWYAKQQAHDIACFLNAGTSFRDSYSWRLDADER